MTSQGDTDLVGLFTTNPKERTANGIGVGSSAVAIYSRSAGIVSWEACRDPCARSVEVKSSHTGMSVNRAVDRVLADSLEQEERRWSG